MTTLLRKLLLTYMAIKITDTPIVQTLTSDPHMITQQLPPPDRGVETSRIMADSIKLMEFAINYQDYILEFGMLPNPYSQSLCSYPAPYISPSTYQVYETPRAPEDLTQKQLHCLALTSAHFKEGLFGALKKSDIRGLSIEASSVSEIEIEQFLHGFHKLEVIRITDCVIPCLNYRSLIMLCENNIKEIYIESSSKDKVLRSYAHILQSVVIPLPIMQHPNIIRLNDQNIFLKAGFKPLQDASIVPWQAIMDLDIRTNNSFVMP